jgi:hypothetical protein
MVRRRSWHKVYYFGFAFWLLQERLKREEITDRAKLEEKDPDFSRVRCPLCGWKPNGSSRWFCGDCEYPEYFFDGCGTAWNTFATRGRCPGCAHDWRWTVCLRCRRWSRHEDWYIKRRDQA